MVDSKGNEIIYLTPEQTAKIAEIIGADLAGGWMSKTKSGEIAIFTIKSSFDTLFSPFMTFHTPPPSLDGELDFSIRSAHDLYKDKKTPE